MDWALRWQVEGSEVGETGDTLDGMVHFDKGWSVVATASADSASRPSEPMVIDNTALTAPELVVDLANTCDCLALPGLITLERGQVLASPSLTLSTTSRLVASASPKLLSARTFITNSFFPMVSSSLIPGESSAGSRSTMARIASA